MVLLVETDADPFLVGARVAFARRVGKVVDRPSEISEVVNGEKVRVRSFPSSEDPRAGFDLLDGLDVEIDLENPTYEVTQIHGKTRYLAITRPLVMKQGWSLRRPRVRPFFHPSAIFPKLARALVNLTRCKEGDVFLDPFSGTGSLPIEAALVGCQVVACDLSQKMCSGAKQNMKRFGQPWLGVVRSDFAFTPITSANAIATDVPYGRASSTMGKETESILSGVLVGGATLLSSGSRMVLMHPDYVTIPTTPHWALEEEHSIYVHKRLTRVISVLRRR
jgi:tRNA (guanine10-N2)-dimethyltransferase